MKYYIANRWTVKKASTVPVKESRSRSSLSAGEKRTADRFFPVFRARILCYDRGEIPSLTGGNRLRSIFGIIGPVMVGPSSSHTAGMARIGAEAFRRLPPDPREIALRFSRKMQATYRGHRSDCAVIGGALGLAPDSPELKNARRIAEEKNVSVSVAFFEEGEVPQNTVRVTFRYSDGVSRSLTASSVGGGSIEILALDGQAVSLSPFCDYGESLPGVPAPPTLGEALAACREGVSLSEQALRYEEKRSGKGRETIVSDMALRLQVMKDSVKAGQGKNDPLFGLTPGDEGAKLLRRVRAGSSVSGGRISLATAYALGVMEHNASMGRVVAAPTAGSAGILPGVLLATAEEESVTDGRLVQALFTAGLLGVIMDRKGVSFSGSVGGCQGEIGVSSALAAAALTSLYTEDGEAVAHAMAMSLKNLLGLVCDPIGGPVEVPCIKRNSVGVANAFICADMALSGIRSFIPPEEVLDALIDVQKRMPSELRCAAVGGLACTETACRWRENESKSADKKENSSC